MKRREVSRLNTTMKRREVSRLNTTIKRREVSRLNTTMKRREVSRRHRPGGGQGLPAACRAQRHQQE